MCNDEIVKLKLNNDEVDKPKNLRKKRKENAYSEMDVDWYNMWKEYILILFLKNMSHQKICIFWFCIATDEVPSTFPQIVEQIGAIQVVVLFKK